MDQATINRLMGYVNDAQAEWGRPAFVGAVSARALLSIELRSDGYANAHVEGEHNANGLCGYATAQECGERNAAQEWVESN